MSSEYVLMTMVMVVSTTKYACDKEACLAYSAVNSQQGCSFASRVKWVRVQGSGSGCASRVPQKVKSG